MQSDRVNRGRAAFARAAAKRRARGALGVAIASGIVGGVFWACGGTTGQEGDSPLVTGNAGADAGADVTVDASNQVDASATYDTGAFDVFIGYADRALPEAAPPPSEGGSGGGGSGGDTPDGCPAWAAAWTSYYDGGDDAPPSFEEGIVPAIPGPKSPVTLVPTDYGPDGAVVLASPGSRCAAYRWYPGTDLTCDIYQSFVDQYDWLAPCSWAIGLGPAQAGPRAGVSRYNICMDLYRCVFGSNCWLKSGTGVECFCGAKDDAGQSSCDLTPPNPDGPCKNEVQAAFEMPNLSTSSIKAIRANYAIAYDPNAAIDAPGLTAPSYGPAIFDIVTNMTATTNHCVLDGGADE